MIPAEYLTVLRKINGRLEHCDVLWVITGSVGMALQGMDIRVHDIDIQTDIEGVYEIEEKFFESVITPVRYVESERIRSHLGALRMDGVRVEIMGAIQKCGDDGVWEKPVRVQNYRNWVEFEGMQIPVLSLEYEYQAYLKLGRVEKAEKIKTWLQNKKWHT
jgi:hypothetical protein